MSEYQYYEFQAIDRPLTKEQMAELRALSSRATITSTRFTNVYHWGDFKGNPLVLMERYFDAFLYVANWGTHRFMLRLPERLLEPQVARRYAGAESLDVHTTGDSVILEFVSQDEEGTGWIEDEEAESWMPALLPLRADLAGGDLRALYLAWLAGIQSGLLDDAEIEPPVPAGLGAVSAPLKALAEFMRIDDDLLAVAAAPSAPLPEEPSPAELGRWIEALPVSEKNVLLLRLAQGDEAGLRAEIRRRFRQASAPLPEARTGGRAAGALLAAAEERAEARRRREAERKAAEQARRQREEAAARARYLEGLAGREEQLWREVEALIETKRPKEYDQAVQLLKDLRDLGTRRQQPGAFAARLAPLRERYAKRPGLIDRLDRAGLRS